MNTRIQMWKGKMMAAAIALLSMMTMSSCDWWHEDQSDCDTSAHLRVKIIYEMNMEYDVAAQKYLDLFGDSVAYVNLFAFDKDGNYVYGRTQSAETIKAQNGYMEVDDMPAGEYNLLVWAEGKTNTANSYTYGYTASSQYISNYDVTVNNAAAGKQLTSLFHGYTLNADLNAKAGEWKEDTVRLTKDTNTWHIYLRYASGKEIDPERFDFKITDSNGYLAYDNSLNTSNITYSPYSQAYADVKIGNATYSGMGAHITVNRLMENNNMTLTVTDKKTGKVVIPAEPIMPYAIDQKNYQVYNIDASKLENQEYLDREDDYVITFDLGDDNTWISEYLYILSWRVIRHNVDL